MLPVATYPLYEACHSVYSISSMRSRVSYTLAFPCRTAVQGGAIKLYKSLVCPLDGYELLLFSLSGADGKTYPLCPFCYNSPPFEGVAKEGRCWEGAHRVQRLCVAGREEEHGKGQRGHVRTCKAVPSAFTQCGGMAVTTANRM